MSTWWIDYVDMFACPLFMDEADGGFHGEETALGSVGSNNTKIRPPLTTGERARNIADVHDQDAEPHDPCQRPERS
jgi:hypothetical protein